MLSLPSLGLLLAGCGILGPDTPDLEREIADHRAVWEATRPAGYTYVVERLCFCTGQVLGPVRVRVEGSSVTSRSYVDGRGEVPAEYARFIPDIDGLFRVLADALEQGADSVTVTWDGETGVPLSLFIDYDVQTADEELGFRVSDRPSPDPTP